MSENMEKDYKQIERQTADYEYSTLMQLLEVSVSKHLLDEHLRSSGQMIFITR